MIAESNGQQEEENTAADNEVRPLVGEELKLAQAERGEREIKPRLDHFRPSQHRQHQWDARPNVVESDDDRAEYEIQDGDGEHTGQSLVYRQPQRPIRNENP